MYMKEDRIVIKADLKLDNENFETYTYPVDEFWPFNKALGT